jgi:hypothetical protein
MIFGWDTTTDAVNAYVYKRLSNGVTTCIAKIPENQVFVETANTYDRMRAMMGGGSAQKSASFAELKPKQIVAVLQSLKSRSLEVVNGIAPGRGEWPETVTIGALA